MSAPRTVALTVLTPSVPAIVNGKPVSPAYWAQLGSSATLIQGAGHIRAIKDPNPKWDPRTSGWFYPPPPVTVPFGGRWSVNDLPDPAAYPGAYYWLGDPSSADGTAGIQSGARQWAADPGTPSAPPWRSFFPYKPSVRAHDSYLPGGNVVHHPKGVHFNSQYIEHMWADFGRDRLQPFTWVIAGMIVSYPFSAYSHTLLDAGRNPDACGFPRLTAEQCNTSRVINDNLPYRTALAVTAHSEAMTTTVGGANPATIRARVDAAIRPKMFFGVFNGHASCVGAYDTGSKRIARGRVEHTGNSHHRYYVLGRRSSHISQATASHIMMFEIRYWAKALTLDELAAQYAQLSSTYQYDRYRAI
jgi:hypothetical protein